MFIVDASALAKAILDEPDSDGYRAWERGATSTLADLVAPHLLRFEIGSIIAREFADADAPSRQAMLEQILSTFDYRADGEANAFDFLPGATYYDASYIALAKVTGGTLVTYDAKMLKAAAKAKVPTLSPRIGAAA